MELRERDCRGCGESSSGDCGSHGPRIFTVPLFHDLPPAAPSSDIQEVARGLSPCDRWAGPCRERAELTYEFWCPSCHLAAAIARELQRFADQATARDAECAALRADAEVFYCSNSPGPLFDAGLNFFRRWLFARLATHAQGERKG